MSASAEADNLRGGPHSTAVFPAVGGDRLGLLAGKVGLQRTTKVGTPDLGGQLLARRQELHSLHRAEIGREREDDGRNVQPRPGGISGGQRLDPCDEIQIENAERIQGNLADLGLRRKRRHRPGPATLGQLLHHSPHGVRQEGSGAGPPAPLPPGRAWPPAGKRVAPAPARPPGRRARCRPKRGNAGVTGPPSAARHPRRSHRSPLRSPPAR